MEYVIMRKQHYQWRNKVSPTDLSISWTMSSLCDASLGRCIPWTMRPLDDASLTDVSRPLTTVSRYLP
jgi:hypothetical protein